MVFATCSLYLLTGVGSRFCGHYFLGIFNKKMNKEGAIAGMIVGIGIMLFYMLKFKFGVFDGGKSAVAGLTKDWWFGISPEGFGFIAMIVNFAVSL